MAQLRSVTLDLDIDMLAALGRAARAAGSSPTDHLRDCLARALRDAAGSAEMAVGLALRQATGWVDLQCHLREAGFVLREAPAGGLNLCSWPRERALMPVETLGHSRAALTLRFGAAFPPSGLPAAPARAVRPASRAA